MLPGAAVRLALGPAVALPWAWLGAPCSALLGPAQPNESVSHHVRDEWATKTASREAFGS